jgi:hypothetical protein
LDQILKTYILDMPKKRAHGIKITNSVGDKKQWM